MYEQSMAVEEHSVTPVIGQFVRPSAHDTGRLRQLRQAGQLVRWKTIAASSMGLESAVDFLPDVKDRPSVLALAMMTNNAYSGVDNTTDWYDIGAPWQLVSTGTTTSLYTSL